MPDMSHPGALLMALDEAVREFVNGEQVGILFSGGLDSAVIASIARNHCVSRLYTVGIAGSHDLTAGRSAAERLGLEWKGIVLDEGEVVNAVKEMTRTFEINDPLTISFEMPLYFVSRCAEERKLMSGQGADELFGGYARYLKLSYEARETEMRKDLTNLIERGEDVERRIASRHGKEIFHPYLHQRVVEEAGKVPIGERISGDKRKAPLVQVAELLDLGEIAYRPKKAAQYGSGIMKAMKRESTRRKVSLKALVEALREECESP